MLAKGSQRARQLRRGHAPAPTPPWLRAYANARAWQQAGRHCRMPKPTPSGPPSSPHHRPPLPCSTCVMLLELTNNLALLPLVMLVLLVAKVRAAGREHGHSGSQAAAMLHII